MATTSVIILLFSVLALTIVELSTEARAAAPSKDPRKTVGFYELKKENFSVKVTNWGATIISVIVPDAKGQLADVMLGYDTLREYVKGTSYFGPIVGRIANRVAGARFVLNGKAYKLLANDGKNTLHGGGRGYSKAFWTVTEKVDGENPYITMYYKSSDGDQGFPGVLDVYVTYKISGDYDLEISMEAIALSKATPVNLAQHTYLNLGGHNSGTILDNKVQLFASHITPMDASHIPLGNITTLSGTPYDFLKPMAVGSRIANVSGGYDNYYVFDSPLDSKGIRKAAIVVDPKSGRRLELWTNQPGVQFYTSNYLNGEKGKNGAIYPQYGALCLETMGFPDAVNRPNFPSVIVKPGETYKHYMLFKFFYV